MGPNELQIEYGPGAPEYVGRRRVEGFYEEHPCGLKGFDGVLLRTRSPLTPRGHRGGE